MVQRTVSELRGWLPSIITLVTCLVALTAGFTRLEQASKINAAEIHRVDVDGCKPSIQVRTNVEVLKATCEQMTKTMDRIDQRLARMEQAATMGRLHNPQ